LDAVLSLGPGQGPVGGSDSQPLFSTGYPGCGAASFSGIVAAAETAMNV